MILKTSTGLSVSLVSFLYYWWIALLDNGVTAIIKAPESIKPGETVTAEVIIKKGNINGFAKLQIETSNGLTILEEDNKGATFSFSGNTAKWIWIALPIEAEFKVKFKVTANASASGNAVISGKFSYIVNNTKQVIEIPAQNITIGEKITEPVAQIPPSPPPPSNNTNTSNISINTPTNSDISVQTNTSSNTTDIPTSDKIDTSISFTRNIENIASNVWLIKINIRKNKIKGFARYNDVLPPGFTAKVEEKDGSSFFVDGNSIKFVWSALPDKETLNISYKLSGNIKTPITLNGDFSYTENNQVVTKTLPPETIQPLVIARSDDKVTPKKENIIRSISQNTIQSKQTSVFFSVQIGAFLKSLVSSSYFRKKYNITDIVQENHESYKKFYSGNFSEYKEARDYRETIKTKGIQDAFVIAHKDNIRITVQEALMITNQKWYP